MADDQKRDIIWHAEQADCPLKKFDGIDATKPIEAPPVDPAIAAKAEQERLERLRALWREIHSRPLQLSGDVAAEQSYIDSIVDRLEGCQCKSGWAEILKAHPPDFSSPEAYAMWTFGRHNDVNIKLGKPTINFAAACLENGWPWAD